MFPPKNRVSAVNIIGPLRVVPVFWVTVGVTVGEEMMTNVTREVADRADDAVAGPRFISCSYHCRSTARSGMRPGAGIFWDS